MALQIKRRRKTVLFYPDLTTAPGIDAAERTLAAAEQDLAAAQRKYGGREASATVRTATSAVRRASKRVAELKAAAAPSVLELALEAVTRKRWAEVEEAHPVRDGNATDKTFRIGWDSFVADILPESVVEARVRDTGEAVEVAPEEWATVVDEIGDYQYQSLALALLELNRSPVDPF